MITLMKGDTVKIVSDPYGGMLGSVVGKTATVYRPAVGEFNYWKAP